MFHYQATPRNLSNSSVTNKRNKKTNHTQESLSSMDPKSIFPHNHHQRHFLKKRKEIYSTSVRKCFSRRSIQQHTAMPNQRHRIPIQESDRRNNEIDTTTIILHRDARGHHNNIHPKRHENHSSQRCKLPERDKSKKSNRWSLIFIQRSNDTTKQRSDY